MKALRASSSHSVDFRPVVGRRPLHGRGAGGRRARGPARRSHRTPRPADPRPVREGARSSTRPRWEPSSRRSVVDERPVSGPVPRGDGVPQPAPRDSPQPGVLPREFRSGYDGYYNDPRARQWENMTSGRHGLRRHDHGGRHAGLAGADGGGLPALGPARQGAGRGAHQTARSLHRQRRTPGLRAVAGRHRSSSSRRRSRSMARTRRWARRCRESCGRCRPASCCRRPASA